LILTRLTRDAASAPPRTSLSTLPFALKREFCEVAQLPVRLVWANRLAVRIAKAANVTRRDIPAFFGGLGV